MEANTVPSLRKLKLIETLHSIKCLVCSPFFTNRETTCTHDNSRAGEDWMMMTVSVDGS